MVSIAKNEKMVFFHSVPFLEVKVLNATGKYLEKANTVNLLPDCIVVKWAYTAIVIEIKLFGVDCGTH